MDGLHRTSRRASSERSVILQNGDDGDFTEKDGILADEFCKS